VNKTEPDLEVWQSSVLFVKKNIHITGRFPKKKKYGLVSQIDRCTTSNMKVALERLKKKIQISTNKAECSLN
jgi:four helix bundle protein